MVPSELRRPKESFVFIQAKGLQKTALASEKEVKEISELGLAVVPPRRYLLRGLAEAIKIYRTPICLCLFVVGVECPVVFEGGDAVNEDALHLVFVLYDELIPEIEGLESVLPVFEVHVGLLVRI